MVKEDLTGVEKEFWTMLGLESLDNDMMSGNYTPTSQIVMGTGRTQNACEMCSNSATTSGCGGC